MRLCGERGGVKGWGVRANLYKYSCVLCILPKVVRYAVKMSIWGILIIIDRVDTHKNKYVRYQNFKPLNFFWNYVLWRLKQTVNAANLKFALCACNEHTICNWKILSQRILRRLSRIRNGVNVFNVLLYLICVCNKKG